MTAPAGVTLSVVIPARDAAGTLGETLNSLLAQTRGDWEAIVVDDGSIDSTRQIAEDYARRNGRIRVLGDGRPSMGASTARNRGVAAAKGRWLHFLDADDWVEPAFVEKMLAALEARPDRKVVYCSARNVTVDGRTGPAWISSRLVNAPFETLARECPLLIHAIVLERALVEELGGFDPELRTGEDGDLWQRVARTGAVFVPVPDAVVFYRARRNSLSTDGRKRMADGRRVIVRGFGPDLRVRHPDPRYANGAGGSREVALAYFALWSAAFDIGEGGTGEGMVEPLPGHSGEILAECHLQIAGGLAAGARLLPDDSFGNDPAFFSAVRGLLKQVEAAAQRPGLARLLECALESEVFRPERLTERLAVGNALFVRRQAGSLQPVEAPPGVDRLYLELRSDAGYLGRAEALMFGSVSARELTALAIEAMSPMVFLKESGLLKRPLFWLHAALELGRLPFCLYRARPWRGPGSVLAPRKLARRILVDAAIALAGPRSSATNEQALDGMVAEGLRQARSSRGRGSADDSAPAEIRDGAPLAAAVGAERTSVASAPASDGRLPILMYHRIAENGPPGLARYRTTPASFAAQVQWLSRHGYRTTTTSDLLARLRSGRPLEPRSVLITFDDGYRDFHDVAWPILKTEQFTAEVMIVTDLVGGMAAWDAAEGTPAALMDWRQIRALSAVGASFGSHMASHSHMANLSSREIVLEAARSRVALERNLGLPCRSIAAPFGEVESGFDQVAARCGYEVGFTIERGAARLGLDPLRLPRIEVQGGWSLETFEEALEAELS